MRKLYNDIIYFVQNHVKPVAPSNVSYQATSTSSSFLLGNASSVANHHHHPKPASQFLGYCNANSVNPKQFGNNHSPATIVEEPVSNNNSMGCKTKLFGVPLQYSKKRLHPDQYASFNANNNVDQTTKARFVLEKDDLGLNLMPPSTC